jgi:hypothetical protein
MVFPIPSDQVSLHRVGGIFPPPEIGPNILRPFEPPPPDLSS